MNVGGHVRVGVSAIGVSVGRCVWGGEELLAAFLFNFAMGVSPGVP